MDKLSHLKNLLAAELGNEFKTQIDAIVDRTVKFLTDIPEEIPLESERIPYEDALYKLELFFNKSGLTNEDSEEEKLHTFDLVRASTIRSFEYRIIDYPDKKEYWELCISELRNITFESIRAKFNL